MLLKVKQWVERFKAWRKERKDERARVLFHTLYGKPGSGVPELTNAIANAIAVEMVKKYYDSRGIFRCAFCVATATLQKRTAPGGKSALVCPAHATTPFPSVTVVQQAKDKK
jgi:flavorubredoxin